MTFTTVDARCVGVPISERIADVLARMLDLGDRISAGHHLEKVRLLVADIMQRVEDIQARVDRLASASDIPAESR